MSGGHFDYQQYRIRDIADTIENDIARALKPKPPMVHEDHWVIHKYTSAYSHYWLHNMKFSSYKEAERYLLSMKDITKCETDYGIWIDKESENVVFQSNTETIPGRNDNKEIPLLFVIHHCVFDHYPYEADVLELEDATIETMKIAYRQLRIAEIYAQRVDWMMSGDDVEGSLQERLKEELEEFEKEFVNKDWTTPYEGWDQNE